MGGIRDSGIARRELLPRRPALGACVPVAIPVAQHLGPVAALPQLTGVVGGPEPSLPFRFQLLLTVGSGPRDTPSEVSGGVVSDGDGYSSRWLLGVRPDAQTGRTPSPRRSPRPSPKRVVNHPRGRTWICSPSHG